MDVSLLVEIYDGDDDDVPDNSHSHPLRTPRWPSGQCFRLESGRPGVRFPLVPRGFFFLSERLPCQAPGVIGSALGLAGPVSVYCDWAR